MEAVKKRYIVDEHDRKIAVQIDIEVYRKIEEILENYALFQLMKENEGDEKLDLNQARQYYQNLVKSN